MKSTRNFLFAVLIIAPYCFFAFWPEVFWKYKHLFGAGQLTVGLYLLMEGVAAFDDWQERKAPYEYKDDKIRDRTFGNSLYPRSKENKIQ